jgi:L-amino acid N-acyltransferase YncA
MNDTGGMSSSGHRIVLREARRDDAEALARIYNHYVLNDTCTFSTVPASTSDREEWIAEHSGTYSAFVAEASGEVIGFGALSRYGQREAWSPTVEMSIYVDSDRRQRGAGRALMEALLVRAEEVGHHAVIGQIVANNEPSLRLAEEMGFQRVGYLREVGEKFGQRLDIVLMEKLFD